MNYIEFFIIGYAPDPRVGMFSVLSRANFEFQNIGALDLLPKPWPLQQLVVGEFRAVLSSEFLRRVVVVLLRPVC